LELVGSASPQRRIGRQFVETDELRRRRTSTPVLEPAADNGLLHRRAFFAGAADPALAEALARFPMESRIAFLECGGNSAPRAGHCDAVGAGALGGFDEQGRRRCGSAADRRRCESSLTGMRMAAEDGEILLRAQLWRRSSRRVAITTVIETFGSGRRRSARISWSMRRAHLSALFLQAA
jgi:hypothetical protein